MFMLVINRVPIHYHETGQHTNLSEFVMNINMKGYSLHIDQLFQKKKGSTSTGGGGFFHSKCTWECAAREGILFRTSSLAKGVCYFSRVKSRQGYAFWEFWSKRCQNSGSFVKKPTFFKFWSRKCENLARFA